MADHASTRPPSPPRRDLMTRAAAPCGESWRSEEGRLGALEREQLAAGRYSEAARTQRQLDKLRADAEAGAQQDLSNRQAAELERLRALFQEEASAFAAAWGAQAEEMAAAALAAQQGLMERQLNELADMKEQQAAELSSLRPTFRASPALLNLRRVEATLAQQRQFQKAQQVQRQADALQAAEEAAQADASDGRRCIVEARVAARQAKEQEVLAARLRTLEGEAQLRREGELKRMARRQQAQWQATERAHARERLQLDAALRGALGIKRPSHLLALPSIGTSMAATTLLSNPKARAASPPPPASHYSSGPASPLASPPGADGARTPARALSRAGSPAGLAQLVPLPGGATCGRPGAASAGAARRGGVAAEQSESFFGGPGASPPRSCSGGPSSPAAAAPGAAPPAAPWRGAVSTIVPGADLNALQALTLEGSQQRLEGAAERREAPAAAQASGRSLAGMGPWEGGGEGLAGAPGLAAHAEAGDEQERQE